MHVEFRNSFLKDIKRLKDRKEKELVKKGY